MGGAEARSLMAYDEDDVGDRNVDMTLNDSLVLLHMYVSRTSAWY